MGVHTGDSHHGRAGADADRQGVPAHARRRDRASSARSASRPAARTSSSRVHPETGRLVVHRDEPARLAQLGAGVSKATGFPIAKIAAKLAVGYTLDEIRNDITRETPACFEPTIDYVVTKIPRFTFEKFPQATRRARPADEVGRRGDGDRPHVQGVAAEGDALARDRQLRLRRRRPRAARPTRRCEAGCGVPNAERLWHHRRRVPARAARSSELYDADQASIRGSCATSRRSSTFEERGAAAGETLAALDAALLAPPKQHGLLRRPPRARSLGSDRGRRCARGAQAARHRGRSTRRSTPAAPSSRRITPYLYSTYEAEDDEAAADARARRS